MSFHTPTLIRVYPIVLVIGCTSSGNSTAVEPNKDGEECSPTVAGWQHACIGNVSVQEKVGTESYITLLSDVGLSFYPDNACCEGSATQATSDEACELGCYAEACSILFGQEGLQPTATAFGQCLTGGDFSACLVDENPFDENDPECDRAYRVSCDNVISNEIFDTDGVVESTEVNGFVVSNLIAQLMEPTWLTYVDGAQVTVDPGDLHMFVTYQIGSTRVAWEASNIRMADGVIDPLSDQFSLTSLSFGESEGDVDVSVEIDIEGSHR